MRQRKPRRNRHDHQKRDEQNNERVETVGFVAAQLEEDRRGDRPNPPHERTQAKPLRNWAQRE